MQVARVAVSDEEWRAFRQLAMARGRSVSDYLGRLVLAEMKRRAASVSAAVEAEASDADRAIAALVDVRAAIDDLDGIAGRLSRSAAAHGASWNAVGRALRLSPSDAEKAFARDEAARQ